MNKAAKVILNILIVIAGAAFLAMMIYLGGSFSYKNREKEDKAERSRRVFEYELENRAYNEIMDSYYVYHNSVKDDPEEEEAMQDIYRVAEYAHAAFMSRVYQEKGDESAVRANAQKMEKLKENLGDYSYTAEEVNEMIQKAP